MKVRLINNSINNMIGFCWSISESPGYYTTLRTSNLYLDGGAGVETTTAKADVWQEYVYDVLYTSSLCSNRPASTIEKGSVKVGENFETVANSCSFADFNKIFSANTNFIGSNNWGWKAGSGADVELAGIYFFLLGAMDSGDNDYGYNNANCDSRNNVKAGAWVEVDYILFGSSVDELNAYTSYIEDEYDAKNA